MLASLGYDFTVAAPAIDETPLPDEKPRAHVERLAAAKARAVAADGLVVAADTIVVLGERILGKPTDAAHARDMLRALSGCTHQVVTGVCVKDAGRSVVFSVATEVVFRALEPGEIDGYVATGEPMDKAGAYAIQGGAAHMVRAIHGSYTNVVGLPLCELHEAIESF